MTLVATRASHIVETQAIRDQRDGEMPTATFPDQLHHMDKSLLTVTAESRSRSLQPQQRGSPWKEAAGCAQQRVARPAPTPGSAGAQIVFPELSIQCHKIQGKSVFPLPLLCFHQGRWSFS